MARTAPAPNVPPIPGMCPGVAVLAGGGGAGGAGGKGSKKGKGKKGAGTKKGKKSATGGKKGAKGGKKEKCGGNGKKAKCTKCGTSPTAGDPIDLSTGAVVVPETVDMELPGPINLQWQRSYDSSFADRDVGLGFGWSFTFGWRFEILGKQVFVTNGEGETQVFDLCAVDDDTESEDGWVLERDARGFAVWCGDDFIHVFRPLPNDASRLVLALVLGPSGNVLELAYDERGRLVRVYDSVGRVVRVTPNAQGRIESIDVPDPQGNSITFATYRYDDAGNLVSATDADGYTTRYSYDEHHRLTALAHPSGLTFHWLYDAQGRCFESWGDYPDGRRDPALAPGPTHLADGVTPVKGVHHVRIHYLDDWREVISATEIQQVFTNENGDQVTKTVGNGGVTTRVYDEHGNEIAMTDPNGFTTTYEYDHAGRLVRETDPLGNSVQLVRDEFGFVMEMIDPGGGSIVCTRDERGFIQSVRDQLGGVTSYVWDERGLMTELVQPNGARSVYPGDAHGNAVEARLPNGAVWRFKYDWWGRVIERIDPLGNVTELRWSPAGRLMAFRERDGGWTVVHRDEMTNPVEILLPDGSVERKHWGAVNWLYEERSPGGIVTRGQYDPDGQLVTVFNGRREPYTIEWGTEGSPRRIVSFGGREELRTFDAMGDMLSEDVGDGKILYTRDANGMLTAAEYPDGTVETFEYNARGELVGAIGPGGELRIERNAVGEVVCETVVASGETTVVRSEWAEDGTRKKLATSLDLVQVFHRDAMGWTERVELEPKKLVTFLRNPLGGVVKQVLPEGACIESEYDALTRVAARRIHRAGASAERRDEPEWVGKKRGGALAKSFSYSPRSMLLTATNTLTGDVRYAYDPDERLLSREPEGGDPEAFTYDETSNVYERGAATREYDRADRLLRSGSTEYRYDAVGRRVAKVDREADGSERVTGYEWNAQGQLAAVVRADGSRVEHSYDPFHRRLTKRVLRTDGTLESFSRYVWDECQLVQERTTWYDASGLERRSELCTYAWEDKHLYAPFAERRIVREGGAVRDEGWVYYCTDILGTPEELVDGQGNVVGVLRRTAFGVTRAEGRSTRIRFPGQYFDEDTSLHYNLSRWYEPETGRYISPDPIGIAGGLNLYAYCTNPITSCDPYGLSHGMFFEVRDKDGKEVGPDPGKSNKPGDWSPLQSGQNGKPFKDKKFGQMGAGDTEAKALHNLDKNKNARTALQQGGTAKMGGEFPPCKRCHRRIKKWMEKKGGKGTIEYHYPKNQKITYNGGKSGKPPVETAKGSNAEKLTKAYDNDKYVKTKKPARNEDGSIKKDPKTGKTIYKRESTASKEYQRQKEIAQNNPGKQAWPDQATKDSHLAR